MIEGLAGKKILVTGADGFIGSPLVEALGLRPAQVRALVLFNSYNSWGWLDSIPQDLQAEIEVVAGDIRDPHFVRTLTQDREIILHLAALVSIPFSYQSPS